MRKNNLKIHKIFKKLQTVPLKMKVPVIIVSIILLISALFIAVDACDCDYHPGGCTISQAPEKDWKCKCLYRGFWTCSGYPVHCSSGENCPGECYSAECCNRGGGDCVIQFTCITALEALRKRQAEEARRQEERRARLEREIEETNRRREAEEEEKRKRKVQLDLDRLFNTAVGAITSEEKRRQLPGEFNRAVNGIMDSVKSIKLPRWFK